jgi:hypothetical protein
MRMANRNWLEPRTCIYGLQCTKRTRQQNDRKRCYGGAEEDAIGRTCMYSKHISSLPLHVSGPARLGPVLDRLCCAAGAGYSAAVTGTARAWRREEARRRRRRARCGRAGVRGPWRRRGRTAAGAGAVCGLCWSRPGAVCGGQGSRPMVDRRGDAAAAAAHSRTGSRAGRGEHATRGMQLVAPSASGASLSLPPPHGRAR